MTLKEVMKKGEDAVRTILNAKDGAILTEMTASQVMFNMVGVIAENIEGNNIVTTVLEHPSSFDACTFYANKTGKELRVAKSNPKTGNIDVEEIIKLIDKDTCFLSFMYASNISGAILDAQKIIDEARKIKPDLYIIIDAVQHAPHGVIDVEKLKVDGINFAPYKMFGTRGMGFGYVSDRVSILPHHKLLQKDPKVWELGSPVPAQFASIDKVVDYVCDIGKIYSNSNDRRELYVSGMNAIKLQERALMDLLLNGTEKNQGLRNIKGVNVFLDGDSLENRDFILAIGIDGLDYTKAVREYEKRNIIVYERVVSSVYSARMLNSFNLKGAIRVSPLHVNDIEDIDRFLEVTKELVSIYGTK